MTNTTLVFFHHLIVFTNKNTANTTRGTVATTHVNGIATSCLHILVSHSWLSHGSEFFVFANLDADCTEVENRETNERLYLTNSQASP